jgi:hypothetical protein
MAVQDVCCTEKTRQGFGNFILNPEGWFQPPGLKNNDSSISGILSTRFRPGLYHLSGIPVTRNLLQPTHPDSFQRKINASNIMKVKIFAEIFALIETYLALQPIRFTRPVCHHTGPWALTPRFHPFPPSLKPWWTMSCHGLPMKDGYFLWHFLSCPRFCGNMPSC